MRFAFEHSLFLMLLVALPAVLIALRFTLLDSPRGQLVLSAATRCLILLLLILALASLLWVSKNDKLSIVVLGDLSDSVTESGPTQVSNYMSQVAAKLPSTAQAGLTTFASTNDPCIPLTHNPRLNNPI